MGRVKVRDIKPLVACILEDDPNTRDDDNILYLLVLSHYANQRGIDLNGLTVPHFLLTLKGSALPGFESVRRARQKVQAERPELGASEAVRGAREEKEEEYLGFARGEV